MTAVEFRAWAVAEGFQWPPDTPRWAGHVQVNRLAQALGVSRRSVSAYLAGTFEPGGATLANMRQISTAWSW